MYIALQMEQFIVERGVTTVRTLARRFRISEDRCRAELSAMGPFGVRLTADDRVLAVLEDAACW